jgi:hypothetical protein
MAEDKRLVTTPEDRRIVEGLLRAPILPGRQTRPVGERALGLAGFFLGSPYAAGTLEQRGAERLVVNLRQFDCFTLVETVVVLTRLLGVGKQDFADYAAALAGVRYRGGALHGYASRLH